MGPLLSPHLMPDKSGAILTDAFFDRPGYVTGFCRHLDGLFGAFALRTGRRWTRANRPADSSPHHL